MSKKIMVMAGGTGGHVFPGIAVANALREAGHEVCWLGTRPGIESRLVPNANIDLHFIEIAGVRGKGALGLIKAPWLIMRAVMQSISVLRQEKPDCILGMGGFVAGPGAVAAKLLGIPLVIHEQNAIAGTTNRILSNIANRVLQAFPNTFAANKKAQSVGNPVRKNLPHHTIEQREKLHILIVGGSLGAKAINDLLPKVIQQMSDVAVVHQTGKTQQPEVERAYQGMSDAKATAFIDDMAEAYAWADLVVCRSGAMTVSEIAAVGLPAIFIPFPHAIDDHQTANAQTLEKHQAALIIQQRDLSEQGLLAVLNDLQAHPQKREAMAKAASAQGIRDAAEKVMTICLEVAR